MSVWTVLNCSAWIISAVIAVVLLIDFLKVERERKNQAE